MIYATSADDGTTVANSSAERFFYFASEGTGSPKKAGAGGVSGFAPLRKMDLVA